MAGRVQSGEWLFWFSLAAVTLVHVQLAYFALTYAPDRQGAIETQTTAISINLEASDVLDAAEDSNSAVQAAAGAFGEAAKEEPGELEPVEEPEPVVEKTEPDPAANTEAGPPPTTESIKEEPPQETRIEQAENALERAMQAELKRREEAERQERLAREEKRRETRSTPSGAGGSGNSGSSSARISASTGSIRNYASMIRSRIARNKPSAYHSGNVVIALNLSTSGGLQSARIVQSSGNKVLDRQALSAVRRAAPFPQPPAGVHSSQLSFTIPFTFQ